MPIQAAIASALASLTHLAEPVQDDPRHPSHSQQQPSMAILSDGHVLHVYDIYCQANPSMPWHAYWVVTLYVGGMQEVLDVTQY